jgi:hypothetical protein
MSYWNPPDPRQSSEKEDVEGKYNEDRVVLATLKRETWVGYPHCLSRLVALQVEFKILFQGAEQQ